MVSPHLGRGTVGPRRRAVKGARRRLTWYGERARLVTTRVPKTKRGGGGGGGGAPAPPPPTPLVVAGHALGLLQAPAEAVEETAALLEQVADRCRRDAEHLVNPAKRLAGQLDGALPVVWGTSHLAAVAAYRFACQLNENAQLPAVHGALPEAGHNQVVALDGPMASQASPAGDPDDFFRDRADDVEQPGLLALVALRDTEEHPVTALRADVCLELARERSVPVVELRAEGASRFARLASLIAVPDFASAYLALLHGTDPTPVDAIDELKARTNRA